MSTSGQRRVAALFSLAVRASALGVLPSLAGSQPGFVGPIDHAAADWPPALAVGDVNRDGKLDVVSAGG